MAKLVLKEHFHSGPSHSSLLRANGFWAYNRTEKHQMQEVALVSITQARWVHQFTFRNLQQQRQKEPSCAAFKPTGLGR